MFSHLSDSAFGLGDAARRLVPGVDCPEHATFLSTTVYNSNGGTHSDELPNALCVFEHNAGVPLRRHRSDDGGHQYGGLVDYVLIVRTIIVEYNYDYIFDFVFHLNGAIEARVYATGYIMAQWFHYGEDPFGFRVHEDVVGSVHHHLFHFKFLSPRSASSTSPVGKMEQISYKHHVRKTEQDAVYHYNFDHPKYHIFYNNQVGEIEVKNKFGNERAYRLEGRGYSKQILPTAHAAVRSRKWMEYQMAVTSRKEEESKSSSIFSMYDGEDPTVDFEQFLKDDENILDQDLVTWVSLGMHHIPHTEDIPNTPTPGTEAAILLLPFNYFPEDPSVGSRDAGRIPRFLS
nr:hypothetical protein BaRGS_023013 [Batillaria attramentaria]